MVRSARCADRTPQRGVPTIQILRFARNDMRRCTEFGGRGTKSDYRAFGHLEKMSEDRSRAEYSDKSLRILVVEDHSDTLQALSQLLNHFGHDISTADNARNALDMIKAKEFDVVLCDIALPDGNGYDVVVEAKRKGAVKAVAISGFGARDDIERGKKAGFDFYLAKPVDFHELRSVLGQIAA